MDPEREYLGGKKAKIWTYLIFGLVLAIGVVAANFVVTNPALAGQLVDRFLQLPTWTFPALTGALGLLIFWLGLKIETDWPEALGALLVAGSVASAEALVGWETFAFGGLTVLPYVIPVLVFLILLVVGITGSR